MRRLGTRSKLNGSIALALASLTVLGIAAPPAAAEFREVSPTGTDAGNDCLIMSGPCATIQHAVDVAENGDWVDVRPGAYAENVTIDKPLTLLGPNGSADPGEPQAILDGGSGTAIRLESHGIDVRGMTVTAGSAGTPIRTSGADVDELDIYENILSGGSSGVQLEAGGKGISVYINLIEDAGEGIDLSGTDYSELAIENNRFAGSIDAHAVLASGDTTIEGLRLMGNHAAAPIRIAGWIAKKQGVENDLAWNSFDSVSGPQLAFSGEEVRVMSNDFDGHGVAGCLQLLGTQGGSIPSSNVLVSLQNEFVDCNPYGVELGPGVDGIDIYGNEFPGSYDGVATSSASSWNVNGRARLRDNRFVGTTHLAVDNTVAGTLDAEQNWWGCNAGPQAANCDGASAGVDAANPITLEALIGPPDEDPFIERLPTGHSMVLNPGEKAEVAALLTGESSEPNLGVPSDKAEVRFSSSLVRLNLATSELHNGWTKTLFTAGPASGQGWIAVTMDNQQTLVPVTIRGDSSSAPPATLPTPSATPRPAAPVIFGKRHLRAGRQITVGTISCADSCRIETDQAWISIAHHRYRSKILPRGELSAAAATPIRLALPGAAWQALRRVGSARIRIKLTVVDTAEQATTEAISARVQR